MFYFFPSVLFFFFAKFIHVCTSTSMLRFPSIYLFPGPKYGNVFVSDPPRYLVFAPRSSPFARNSNPDVPLRPVFGEQSSKAIPNAPIPPPLCSTTTNDTNDKPRHAGTSIPAEVLTPLVEALLLALKDTPRVCSKACFALHNFGDQFEESRDADTNALSPYLTALVQELLVATQRDDGELLREEQREKSGTGNIVLFVPPMFL